MNCKPGDLAAVVSSNHGNEGKIVRCVRILPIGTRVPLAGGRGLLCISRPRVWEVEGTLNIQTEQGFVVEASICQDDRLRPIRPDDGEDETLTWAGKPNNVKEYAK